MKIISILAEAPYGHLKNTPEKPLIDTSTVGDSLKTIVDNINTFNDYMLHPSHILKPLWNSVEANSLNICLFIALSGFLIYAIGYKKGSKLTIGSMAAYFLIKCLSKM